MPSTTNTILSAFAAHNVQYLLMGGQACILYGGAEFSRDTDIAVVADTANTANVTAALFNLNELDTEQREERRADAAYWAPQRQELEDLRHSVARGDLRMNWPPEAL